MEKEVNLNDVIKYLSRAFQKAASRAAYSIGKQATRTLIRQTGEIGTTILYDYQVDYCYLIDTVKRGTRYESTKAIQRANELIAELEKEGN